MLRSDREDVFFRKELERGVCFLMWIAGVARALKPWLAAFYNNLSRPAVAKFKLTLPALGEVARSMRARDCTLQKPCLEGRIKFGWRVLTIGGYQVRSTKDLLQPPRLSNGVVLTEFSSKTSMKTRVSEEAGFAAKLWMHALQFSFSQGLLGPFSAWRYRRR